MIESPMGVGGTRGGIKGGERPQRDSGRIKILCQRERLSVSVDPQLRVSTNQNPHTNDPQRSRLVRTRLCLTVRESIEEGSRDPFTTQTMIESPMGVGGTRGGIKGGERPQRDSGRIKILCQRERLSVSVDPQLRVSTNQNPHTNDPQRSRLVRTRLCLTVRESIEEGSRDPFTTQTMIESPLWGVGGHQRWHQRR